MLADSLWQRFSSDWISYATVFGLGGVVGNICTFLLTSRWQHCVWLNDNKKAEWRELIDALNQSIERMGYAFEVMVARAASDPARNWMESVAQTNIVVRGRIFISR